VADDKSRQHARVGPVYWMLTFCLIGFGVLGILSIGAPFLLLGLVLLLLAPFRARPMLFWPTIVGVLGFFAGFILVSPLVCATSETSRANEKGPSIEASHTVCTNLIGIDYSGTGSYTPDRMPALLAGVGLASAGAALSAAMVRQRSRSDLAEL